MTNASTFTFVDPYREACEVLEQIEVMVESRFPERWANVGPVIRQAGLLLDQLGDRGRTSAAKDATASSESDVTREALREQLREVLNDLEDLCEVYSGVHAIRCPRRA